MRRMNNSYIVIVDSKKFMEKLISILSRASEQLEEGWLYLPKDEAWSLDTLGLMIDIEALEDGDMDENDVPVFAKENGLMFTLEAGVIESIVLYAEGLGYESSDIFLLESFLYYYKYDAFLSAPQKESRR